MVIIYSDIVTGGELAMISAAKPLASSFGHDLMIWIRKDGMDVDDL